MTKGNETNSCRALRTDSDLVLRVAKGVKSILSHILAKTNQSHGSGFTEV